MKRSQTNKVQKTVLGFAVSIASASVLGAPLAVRAETGWAQAKLWQTPVVTTLALGLGDGTEELKAECANFEKLNQKFAKLNSKKHHKKMFEEQRKQRLKSSNPGAGFAADLALEWPANGEVLQISDREALKRQAEETARNDKRPYQTLAADWQFIDSASLQASSVPSLDGSLVQTATELGLEPSAVSFVEKQGGVQVVVSGKDLACDLIQGRAQLVVSARSYAQLSLERQVKMKSFFAAISDAANAALVTGTKARHRAGLLGYRLGRYFEGVANLTPERSDAAIVATMDAFFDPQSLDRNGLWTSVGSEKTLVPSAVSDAFEVKVTIARGGNN
jgi:hypothetical protein